MVVVCVCVAARGEDVEPPEVVGVGGCGNGRGPDGGGGGGDRGAAASYPAPPTPPPPYLVAVLVPVLRPRHVACGVVAVVACGGAPNDVVASCAPPSARRRSVNTWLLRSAREIISSSRCSLAVSLASSCRTVARCSVRSVSRPAKSRRCADSLALWFDQNKSKQRTTRTKKRKGHNNTKHTTRQPSKQTSTNTASQCTRAHITNTRAQAQHTLHDTSSCDETHKERHTQ